MTKSLPETMRQIRFTAAGGPEVIAVETVPRPEPAAEHERQNRKAEAREYGVHETVGHRERTDVEHNFSCEWGERHNSL